MNQVVRFRAVAGVSLALVLVAGGVAALAESIPGCTPNYTDPAGDAAPGSSTSMGATAAGAQDDDLDLLEVTHDSQAGALRTVIKVKKLLATGPDLAFGDAFESHFTVESKVVDLFVTRDVEGKTITTKVNVAGKAVPVKLTPTFDVKASTITLSVPIADLGTAVGAPLDGASMTKLSSRSASDYLGNGGAYYDTATAAATVAYTIGTSCAGGTAAASSPSPSMSASASASPSASSSPSAGGAMAGGLPTPGCGLGTDPKGDAKPLNANNPNSDPDLDLTGLTFGTLGSNLVAYAKVDKLGAGPTSSTDGHRFTFNFTHNKHVFAMAGSAYKTATNATIKDNLASTGQFSRVTQLTVDGPPLTDPNSRTNPGFVSSGLKFTFDQKNSYVIATLPIADIDKYGKAPFAGSTLTLISATAATDTTTVSSQADILPDGAPTTKPSALTYTAGDNSCFAIVSASAPATATSLIVSAPSRVQTGDSLPVSVTFTDGAGKPQAGASITARLGNGPTASAKTDANGKAAVKVAVTGPGATRTLVVSSGAASVRRTTTVLAERSLLNYAISGTGDTRLVTVTLTDDDRPTRHPYAGATVTFAYDGTSMTAKTDSKGQAFVRVRTGTKIDMTYAGKPGLVTSAVRRTEVE